MIQLEGTQGNPTNPSIIENNNHTINTLYAIYVDQEIWTVSASLERTVLTSQRRTTIRKNQCVANAEMIQAEFAQGQLDKDDVHIKQICVVSETERERERERESTKHIELLTYTCTCMSLYAYKYTYVNTLVAMYLPGTVSTILAK